MSRPEFTIKQYMKVVEDWGLCDSDAQKLIGVTEQEWQEAKQEGKISPLGAERCLCRDGIISIHRTLHMSFGPTFANNWPTNPNRLFNGESPVESMIAGGLPKIKETYKFVYQLMCSEFN